LLSSIGVFGAAKARELTLTLEEQAGRADFIGAEQRLDQLHQEIDTIQAALTEYAGVFA